MSQSIFNSQAGQDRFVYELLVKNNPNPVIKGLFLDIGCNDPITFNNTYVLEQLGWSGYLFDVHEGMVNSCRSARTSQVYLTDTTAFNWEQLPQKHYNYISADVDYSTIPTVEKLFKSNITFDVATIEHDCYQYGTQHRDCLRSMLLAAGYVMYAGDVCVNDGYFNSFEDWWVSPKYKDIAIDRSFITTRKDG